MYICIRQSYSIWLFSFCLVSWWRPTWQQEREAKGPARIGCNAAHSVPCAFTNAQWLATTIAENNANNSSLERLFREINLEQHNYPGGFYPFVFDRETGICVAHGRDVSLVSLDLPSIFQRWGLGFSSPHALHERFIRAANEGGDWVRHLSSSSNLKDDDGDNGKTQISSKISFVTNLTDQYYIGVGFQQNELPPDPSCSNQFDSWCSFNNIQSLVGKAQAQLNSANSLEDFESAIYDISFDPTFQIEQGFYLFLYDYNGRLKAHGVLHDYFNSTLSQILLDVSDIVDDDLHQQFLRAAEGESDGWVQYPWRNNVNGQMKRKIALVVKIEFEGQEFYLGAGFNHQRGNLLNGPLAEDDCSGNYSLPCSSQNSLVLSSHALAHLVSFSNATNVDAAFEKFTQGDQFGFSSGDYYLFAFDYNGTCVAHGLVPQFVGKSLQHIFQEVGIQFILDGNGIHDQFKQAAMGGGGWVRYNWLNPGENASSFFPFNLGGQSYYDQDFEFEKVSFVFPIHLGGRSYYVGIGFNHEPLPISQHLTRGTKRNGEPIPCLRLYDDECSEKNIQSVVGQALVDLTLQEKRAGVNQVLESITNQQGYRHTIDDCNNDTDDEFCSYFVMVFSYDACNNLTDSSGCCVAHGNNATRVGMSWQDILDNDGVTSIKGRNLHNRLRNLADAGGGSIVDHFESQDSDLIKKKRIWASRFRVGQKSYYVVAEDIVTPLPPTCDACPHGMHCIRPNDSFCTDIPQQQAITTNPAFITGTVLLVVAAMLCIAMSVYIRTKRRQLVEKLTQQMAHYMQGILKVVRDMPPISSFSRDHDVEMGMAGDEVIRVPRIPDDAENILPAIEGQILQVTESHGEWLRVVVIFDPLLNDARSQEILGYSPLDNAISSLIRNRPMAGWVPKSFTEHANAHDLEGLLDSIGGAGMESLKVPEFWEDSLESGPVPVEIGTREYNEVNRFFMSSLQQNNVHVHSIQRCQNLALWQSYAVKKQTVKTRDLANPAHRVHNTDGNIERKWLFHGTGAEAAHRIIIQGFNRNFAGQNAVAFGLGTYFAKDASYSAQPQFAQPDENNLQRVFLCRVVVGDWCKGNPGQPTPDGKPHNPLELFDTTVDNVPEPSIFVTFHDSSAYPEYLITFHRPPVN